MPRERLPMRKIHDVLRLHADGLSKRRIAVGLNIGRTAVGDYPGYLTRPFCIAGFAIYWAGLSGGVSRLCFLLVQSGQGRVAGFGNGLVSWILGTREVSPAGTSWPFSGVADGLGLWGRQSGMSLEEQGFAGTGVGQGELDAPHGVDDPGADLEQLGTDGRGNGVGQGGVFQGDAADAVDEDIGEGGEDQALPGWPCRRARSCGRRTGRVGGP